MERLLEFAANHWVLTLALWALLAAIGWTFVYPRLQGILKVTPLDATQLINHEEAIVLDVRGEAEFSEGHILNSMHIPMKYLSEQMRKLEKHRSRPIITACRTGQQSAGACAMLRKHGFERVYNLSGGILGWQNASLPLTKK
ncbi:MAG: rhodanese-like domain-containing protein [Gammaproteobacteria bacterium]